MEKSNLKKDIAFLAADTLIRDGMKIGLGTGTTAGWVVVRLSELIQAKKITSFSAVATSFNTRRECERLGIPVTSPSDPVLAGSLDLTIDGADEIDPGRAIIKGAGGAMLLEKIIAYASSEFAIVADSGKLVDILGSKNPVPVEVIPEALTLVNEKLKKLGATTVDLRMAKHFSGPVFTEHNNLILDVRFKEIKNPPHLEHELKNIPGVVETGLFNRPVNHLFIGYPDGRIKHL